MKGLRAMIDICEKYASEYNVVFNGKKSKLLIYKGRGCKISVDNVRVNGDVISCSNEADHLGHRISVNNNNKAMITAAIAQFWKSYNIFMSDFGAIYSFLKCKLFKQYCCSFYGSNLWLLTSDKCKDICVAWRKSLRKVWNVPYMTHKRVIAILSNCLPLECSLEKRFTRFANDVLSHKTKIIKFTANVSLHNPQSTFSKNFRHVCNKYGPDVQVQDVLRSWYDNISDYEKANNVALNDVIDVRDGYKQCNLSPDEIFLTIQTICTN